MTLQEIADTYRKVVDTPYECKTPEAQRNIYIAKSVAYFSVGFLFSFYLTTFMSFVDDKSSERMVNFIESGSQVKYEYYGDYMPSPEVVEDVPSIVAIGESLMSNEDTEDHTAQPLNDAQEAIDE